MWRCVVSEACRTHIPDTILLFMYFLKFVAWACHIVSRPCWLICLELFITYILSLEVSSSYSNIKITMHSHFIPIWNHHRGWGVLDRAEATKSNSRLIENLLGSTTTRMKKRCKKHRSITDTRNYMKNSNREKTTEPHTNPLLSERLQERRRESSQPLYTLTLTID